jgi:predicted nucleic acid-binding protein
MTFLDTSTLVGALLEKHPQHAACLHALEDATATFARRKGARRIVTRNPSHFSHAVPELEIAVP